MLDVSPSGCIHPRTKHEAQRELSLASEKRKQDLRAEQRHLISLRAQALLEQSQVLA